jgi:DNA-binding CsgD family transcriptional regulator
MNAGAPLRGRVGLSPVMVGRSSAINRLLGLIDAADVMTGDQPSVALVSGEPGIGKTRLVREALGAAPNRITTLAVSAQPGSMGRPLDAVVGLAPADVSGDVQAEAVLAAVRSAAQHGPTVLVVEDLHWIDAASANLIDRIAQQPWPNLVLIATYRPTDLVRGQPGGELVLRLERRHSVEQLRLERLGRSDVSAMVGAISAVTGTTPSSAMVEALYRRSSGVPFVVEELLRAAGPRAIASDLLEADLPWSLEEAVRQQVAELAHGHRRLVEALAVYGRSASFDALLVVTESGEDELLADLRALVAAGVVFEVADDQFWFSHALVAEAIVEQLLGRERRRLHERCFEAVRAAPVLDHASLARHAEGAGRHDEVPAIARKGAARYLQKGLTFSALRLAAEGLGEAPNDPELLAVATEAAWRLDFGAEALDTATRWQRVAVEVADRIEATRFVARLHHELDDDAASLEALRQLEQLAASLDDVQQRGTAAAAIAQVHMISGRDEIAVEWAERALADARAAGDSSIEARALVERAGSIAGSVGRPRAESLVALDEALRAARCAGDAVLLTRAINNGLDLLPAHSAEAGVLRAEMRDVSSRVGFDKLGTGNALLWEISAAYGDGDLAALRRVAAEGSQWWVRRAAPSKFVSSAELEYALEEGRIADATEAFLDFSACCPNSHRQYSLRFDLALAAARGDRDRVASAFDELLDTAPFDDAASTLNHVIAMVEQLLGTGTTPALVRGRLLDGWLGDHPSADAFRAHAEGLLRLAEDDHEGAVVALAAVLDTPDDRLARPLIGSLRTAHAEALLGVGDRPGALIVVRRAIDDDLGRWPGVRRDRAQALARRLEGASTRADGELTAREQEVATLLAEGLTNGQVAERLFISPKTAAVHVSNILAKLGLSSRAEIAAWAVRHELAGV